MKREGEEKGKETVESHKRWEATLLFLNQVRDTFLEGTVHNLLVKNTCDSMYSTGTNAIY